MSRLLSKLSERTMAPNSGYGFLRNLVQNRWLLVQLTRQDFKHRFAASALGSAWAFIQPVMTILVLWVVLEYGLRAGNMSGTDMPFILWFMTGMLPWFLFSDGFLNASTSILEKAYLVNKVVFQVPFLPLVKILTAYVVHVVTLVFLFILFGVYGYAPGIHAVQILYYMFAMLIFLVGLGWISSALSVFTGDVSQLFNILVQVGFWATPIMWNIDTMFGPGDSRLKSLFELNPVYYIVEGYRNSLIHNVWFWEQWDRTLWFWGMTLVTLAVGTVVFRRLRPHFADIL